MLRTFLVGVVLCTLASSSFVTAQQGGDFNFESLGGDKFCKPYRCSRKGEEAVPQWPLKLTSTGCSSMGGMQVFTPGESDESDPLTGCCHLRNACFQTCGTTKTFCDEEFRKCGETACTSIDNEEERQGCEKSQKMNNLLVQIDSCQRYDKEQHSHCECVPEEQAPVKREKVLRAFYKKFNPNSIDKVPGLAKKADTSSKMAGLLMKLYKKYPDVIKKVKNEMDEMMARAMKENREKESKTSNNDDQQTESDAEDLGTEEL